MNNNDNNNNSFNQSFFNKTFFNINNNKTSKYFFPKITKKKKSKSKIQRQL